MCPKPPPDTSRWGGEGGERGAGEGGARQREEGGVEAGDGDEGEPDTPKRIRKKLTPGNVDTIKRAWDLGCREGDEATGRTRAQFAGQLLGYHNRRVDDLTPDDFARGFAWQHTAKPMK
jgi:hypothetical protein